ncbi:transglutaminase-like cysteine peptidase [Aestuariivirga sp.]|uniref:transglutaminase-like cysteine peptidase n=1 Tax=Aestuariivirga sp. TaxID=2650926 RepID=UPI00391B76CC
MRGAHAARAALLILSLSFCGLAAADQFVREPDVDMGEADLAELGEAKMPSGLANLCAREPAFCEKLEAGSRRLILSSERFRLLSEINSATNQQISSTTDKELYGRVEFWTLPDNAGDCEDYVLLKRQRLAAAGIPRSSLLITVVQDENGEGHAVLTIPTTSGDLVLDNRRDEILSWQATGYKFVKRQSAADPNLWVALAHEKLQATDIASGPEAP